MQFQDLSTFRAFVYVHINDPYDIHCTIVQQLRPYETNSIRQNFLFNIQFKQFFILYFNLCDKTNITIYACMHTMNSNTTTTTKTKIVQNLQQGIDRFVIVIIITTGNKWNEKEENKKLNKSQKVCFKCLISFAESNSFIDILC